MDLISYRDSDPAVIEALKLAAGYEGGVFCPQPYDRTEHNQPIRRVGYRKPLHAGADAEYLFETDKGHAVAVKAEHVEDRLAEVKATRAATPTQPKAGK